ncbi:MAG: hypothetical protein M3536_13370, partial [Actinomycetota bacterium]|nr:hypothetical protein [Actinomycetota bacterium]
HRARLRRVLRQPLPPERRRGAGIAQLAERRGIPRFQRTGTARGVTRSWAVEDDDETIADGAHLDPETVPLVFELVGAENVVLVTDSMAATGLPDGDYELGPAVGV